MKDRELLGRRIKELRRLRGLSQEQMAERMGSAAKYLSSLERGRENPSLEMLAKVARALGVEVVELFNYAWFSLTDAELRRNAKALIDKADSERLRELFVLVKARAL